MTARDGVTDPVVATPARRRARMVLGPALPYLLHLRPAEWPIVAAHASVGWLLARGIAAPDTPMVWGIAVWVVALNGGTLALNSAFDRDEGDVAYLRNPPSPPAGLAWFGATLIAAGAILAWQFPLGFRLAYLACAVMSVAYSVPPVRLKAIGGADWVINMIGFGTLTAYAGWAITGYSVQRQSALVLLAFCPLFAALYPLTQLYQVDADRDRGDMTLAVRLGTTRALAVACACAMLAFAMLAAAGWATGWRQHDLRRWGALLIAGLAWAAVLVPWLRTGHTWASNEHQRGMYHALAAWALTDAAIVVAWCL